MVSRRQRFLERRGFRTTEIVTPSPQIVAPSPSLTPPPSPQPVRVLRARTEAQQRALAAAQKDLSRQREKLARQRSRFNERKRVQEQKLNKRIRRAKSRGETGVVQQLKERRAALKATSANQALQGRVRLVAVARQRVAGLTGTTPERLREAEFRERAERGTMVRRPGLPSLRRDVRAERAAERARAVPDLERARRVEVARRVRFGAAIEPQRRGQAGVVAPELRGVPPRIPSRVLEPSSFRGGIPARVAAPVTSGVIATLTRPGVVQDRRRQQFQQVFQPLVETGVGQQRALAATGEFLERPLVSEPVAARVRAVQERLPAPVRGAIQLTPVGGVGRALVEGVRPEFLRAEQFGRGSVPRRIARTAGQFAFGVTVGLPETAQALALVPTQAAIRAGAALGARRGFLTPTQRVALGEVRRTGRESLRQQFTTVEGITTSSLAVAGVGLGGILGGVGRGRIGRVPPVKPPKTIRFEQQAKTLAQVAADRPVVPTRRVTTRLEFEEPLRGGFNIITGRNVQTKVKIRPDQTVVRTQRFGFGARQTKVVTTQKPGSPTATVRTTTPAGKITTTKIPALETQQLGAFRTVGEAVRRRARRISPQALAQEATRARALAIEEAFGGGVIEGDILQQVRTRQVSILEPTRFTPEEVQLRLQRGQAPTVEGVIRGPTIERLERLEIAGPRERVRPGERVRRRGGKPRPTELISEDVLGIRVPSIEEVRPPPVSFLEETIVGTGTLRLRRPTIRERIQRKRKPRERAQPRAGRLPFDIAGDDFLVARRLTAPGRDTLGELFPQLRAPRRRAPPRAPARGPARLITEPRPPTRVRKVARVEPAPAPQIRIPQFISQRATRARFFPARLASPFAGIAAAQRRAIIPIADTALITRTGRVQRPRGPGAREDVITIPRITTRTRQRQRQLFATPSLFAPPRTITVPRTPAPTPSGRFLQTLAPGGFGAAGFLPAFGPLARRRRAAQRGRGRRRFKRTPSLIAIEFGIRAPPGKRRTPTGGFLGIELRGI